MNHFPRAVTHNVHTLILGVYFVRKYLLKAHHRCSNAITGRVAREIDICWYNNEVHQLATP